MKSNYGITLIALVITIIVLLILAGISIASLTGENGILTKADTAKEKTEIEDAKEQAKLDIEAYIADKAEKGQSTELSDTIIQGILAGKDYVKGEAGEKSFKTKKSGYDVPYSDLYKAPIKKIKFTIVCTEDRKQYAGTYEVEEGKTWNDFFSANNPKQYDKDYGGMRPGWWYRDLDGTIALWCLLEMPSGIYVRMYKFVNSEDEAIQYKDNEIKARYLFCNGNF